jgi:hypothetical protein
MNIRAVRNLLYVDYMRVKVCRVRTMLMCVSCFVYGASIDDPDVNQNPGPITVKTRDKYILSREGNDL